MQYSSVTSNAKRSSFVDYSAAGFGPHILPIVPPRATISPQSATLNPTKLGKTPGKWTSEGYVGFHRWPEHQTSTEDVARWDRWMTTATPPSIALQGRAFPAVDIDVTEPELAARVKARVLAVAGVAPARHVTDPLTGVPGCRLALFYRSTLPLASWQIEFSTSRGEVMMVEFKADKTQVVAEGAHSKGGAYVYPDGPPPAAWGAENLTEMTPDLSLAVHSAVIDELLAAGCAILSDATSRTSAGAPHGRGNVGAPSLADVKAALDAAPNGDDINRAEWVKIAHNVKGACVALEEDGFDLFTAWGEELNSIHTVETLWAGLPDRPDTGWPELARWARARSKGAFKANLYEFTNDNMDTKALRDAAIEEMFASNLWVENQERVFDVRDQRLRNRQQFNSHMAAIGKPSVKGKCAWDVFMNEPDAPTPLHPTARRQTVFDMTYLPGAGLLVGNGAERRVNLWRAPAGIPDGDVSDEDVRPWLDHVELIVPDPLIRDQLLDWMASVVQRQSEKPNHGVVIGGRHGIGKSMLIEPLRHAFGFHNVKEILASELDSSFSGWLAQTKLFVVEEMMNFHKKEMMQRLKTYLAAPPHTLQVNPKYGKTFTIPNLVAGMFFTNHEDAVAIEPGERRFFVIWSEAPKQPPSYFAELARWYNEGGALLAARWLWLRDASDYNMLGEAPDTAARKDMRDAGRSLFDELIETSIDECQWPFIADLVAVDDVRAWVPSRAWAKSGAPTAARVRKALIDAGAVLAHPKDQRPALGLPPAGCPAPACSKKQARLYAVRNQSKYVGMTNAQLVAAFWAQRVAAMAALDELDEAA